MHIKGGMFIFFSAQEISIFAEISRKESYSRQKETDSRKIIANFAAEKDNKTKLEWEKNTQR